MPTAAVEIEVDGPHNENVFFPPLMRSIRGRFDFNRIPEPQARVKGTEWPIPIPSQRLGIDPVGTGYITEPLHDDAFAPIKEKIERDLGKRLPPELETFDNVDLPTWQHFLKLAVESGIARVVSGKLPDKIDGKPQLDFITNREPSSEDKLTAAIEKQTETFERLIDALLDKA